MLKELKSQHSKIEKQFEKLKKIKEYFDNKEIITNILSEIIITLGVVLIVGGLYLMILVPGSSNQASQTAVAAQSVINTTTWIPGLPFLVQDLLSCNITTIGLVSWIMGMNLLLTGLGLWIRHRIARLAALAIFSLATAAQFLQVLLMGIAGSPNSIALLVLDGVITYLLFTRMDLQAVEQKTIRPTRISSAIFQKNS